jgi:Dolichyl-phosphate-mannose-protein mannosyltransferase
VDGEALRQPRLRVPNWRANPLERLLSLVVRAGESVRVPDERSATAVLAARGRGVDFGIFSVAMVLGTVLRVIQLGAVGFNSDEAVYAGQSASLAGNPAYVNNFPVVRAHPLLFQLLASPFYRSGVHDVPGRYLSALFGVATIALVFQLGRLLYGRRAGALAALLLAVMPYHVIITRQVLLDGPMTFFATAAMVCLAQLAKTGRSAWLVAAASCLGLASLTKETAAILIVSTFVFLSLVPRFWRPVRYVVAATLAVLILVLMYPVVTAMSGAGRSGQSYLLWQLSRRPNNDFLFYFTVVPASVGVLLIATATVGLILLRHRSSWREVLLLAWITVPFVFFEVWPVKGFPYLVMLTPAIAVLAARALSALVDLQPRKLLTVGAGVVATVAVFASLTVPSLHSIFTPSSSGLAGDGGMPGGREAGIWVDAHVPQGARLMTLGPSMGNVLEYYSGRHADGLSVSANPLHRNPSYLPIPNPDVALRSGDYQYVVWDAYSAKRSPSFAARELALIHKYHGRVVNTETATFDGKAKQPVVVIYEVQP